MPGHPPLKPVQHLTLLLLAEQPSYGVELLERVEARSGGAIRLNAGSLYRVIAQLVDAGLIEPVREAQPAGGVGAPRKVYGCTANGREALRAEGARQAELVEMTRALGLTVES
jgi:DNA-binding PadR family transcriptional regulator